MVLRDVQRNIKHVAVFSDLEKGIDDYALNTYPEYKGVTVYGLTSVTLLIA